MKTDTYNEGTVWFLSTPIRNEWHYVRPPVTVVFFCPLRIFLYLVLYEYVGLMMEMDAIDRMCRLKKDFAVGSRIKNPNATFRAQGSTIM